MTFKQRVHKELIAGAAINKAVFVDYEYLVFSKEFNNKPYYIIGAAEDNYPHLTGVTFYISAQSFYDACLNGTLNEADFDFACKGKSEKEVIGSVRRKIQVLPLIANFFSGCLQAEEDFIKGSIHCSLATADNTVTIGFVDSGVLRPKTLLKKNELKSSKAVSVSLVIRRSKGKDRFDEIIQGDIELFCSVHPGLFTQT